MCVAFVAGIYGYSSRNTAGSTITTYVSGGLESNPLLLGPLILLAESDKSSYRLGETVIVSITLTNNGKEPVTVSYSIGKLFDVVVHDYAGSRIGAFSDGKFFPLTRVVFLTLRPSESHTEKLAWSQHLYERSNNSFKPIPPGRYGLQAVVLGTPIFDSSVLEETARHRISSPIVWIEVSH